MKLLTLFTVGFTTLAVAMPSGMHQDLDRGNDQEHQNLTARGDQKVTIAVGDVSEIVGPLQAGPLYGAVYKALEELYPKGSSHCKLESETQALFPIRFKSPNDILDFWMRVRVERSNHATEQIRRLLIGTVAASMEAMVFEPNNKLSKNCEELWIDPIHPYFKQCVISNYVGVATTDRRNILDVKFLSVDDHKKGFDCQGSLNDVYGKTKGLLNEYGQALGGSTTIDAFCV